MPKKKRNDAERRLNQNSRLARVLRILELIQGRGRWNAKSLAAELEWSERTIYRDLAALEVAGVPWTFDKRDRCYRVRPGFRFPVLNLDEVELAEQATAAALSSAVGLTTSGGAHAATSKIAATSSAETARLLEDVERLVHVLDLKLADHSRHQETIKTVQWALVHREQLQGSYESPYFKKPVRLRLIPYRLCLLGQAWYLIARRHDRDYPQTFRVARFRTLRSNGQETEVPHDFDLNAYFGNAWSVFRGSTTYDVEVEFTPEAARLVTETTWHATQEVARRFKDGSIVMRFRVDGLEEIVWWVLGWSGRAKVLKPAELVEKVVSQLRAALAEYPEEAKKK